MSSGTRARFTAMVLAGSLALAISALGQSEWLSQCGQCLSPSVYSKSGIGTSHAVAEAKVTRKDAEGWCENWSPEDKACLQQQLASEAGKNYRATADCSKGKITAIDGNAYTYGGVWTTDVGKGRSKWRDASGKLVGQDEASGGLAIAQQWELLCPSSTGAKPASRANINH